MTQQTVTLVLYPNQQIQINQEVISSWIHPAKSTPVNRIGNNNGNDYINATLLQNTIDNANTNHATPLSLAQGPPSSVGSESVYKFPPISNACLNYSAGDSDSEVESMSMKQAAKNTIIPPMAPPFALQSKSSPLSTPPRLHSPLGVDRGLPISMSLYNHRSIKSSTI